MPLSDFAFDPSYRSCSDFDPDQWRSIYSFPNCRYLEDLSDAQLQRRYENILRNKASFCSPRHVACRPHNDWNSFWYWVRREEEVEEEFKIRHQPLPIVALNIPSLIRSVGLPPGDPPLPSGGIFARFAKHGRLLDSLEKGAFRINHAEGFDAASLNAAQRDDELNAESFSPSKTVRIELPGGREVRPIGQVKYTSKHGSDAYVLCGSTEFDPWLFHYFPADACLIIENIEELRLRLDAAFKKQMPGYDGAEFSVQYVDEENPNPVIGKNDDPRVVPKPLPVRTKSIAFAQQKEFRFVWDSFKPPARSAPKFIDIEAGSLRDISRYYRLDKVTGEFRRLH